MTFIKGIKDFFNEKPISSMNGNIVPYMKTSIIL